MDLITYRRRTQRGFTLVELLIVVIILGILAAVAIPQFTSSTQDTKISALDTNLSNMRAAVELYKYEHGVYPGVNPSQGSNCTGSTGTDGTGNSNVAFIEQLSQYTDVNGEACDVSDPLAFKFGPYLKKSELPQNPVTGSNALSISTVGSLAMAGDGAGLGWKFDVKTGKLIANDTNKDPSGISFDKH